MIYFSSTSTRVLLTRQSEVVWRFRHLDVVPTASPATLPELATYLESCAPLFRRSTSRARGERSPLWGAPVIPGRPSPGAAVAFPRRRALAHRDQPNCPFPPQANLTK